MSERLHSSKETRAFAATLVAAAAIAGFSGEAKAQPLKHGSSTEIAAMAQEQSKNPYEYADHILHGMNTGPLDENIIANASVVLPGGTPVKKAPMGSSEAMLYKVKSSDVLLLERPRLYQDGKSLWAAVWSNKGVSNIDIVRAPVVGSGCP